MISNIDKPCFEHESARSISKDIFSRFHLPFILESEPETLSNVILWVFSKVLENEKTNCLAYFIPFKLPSPAIQIASSAERCLLNVFGTVLSVRNIRFLDSCLFKSFHKLK